MQKQFIIIFMFILLFTSIVNAETKDENKKFEILKSADYTVNQTIKEVSETRKIFDQYLNGNLYPQEAVKEINKIQKKIINIQNQTKMNGNNKDMILYIYKIKSSTNKLQNSLERLKNFIKKDYADNPKRMKDFLTSQTNDLYTFITEIYKAEKEFLYNAEIEDSKYDINQTVEDYIAMRKYLVDIKNKQQEISKETELVILNLTFGENRDEESKKISDIIRKAENVKQNLQQMPKIESMNVLRESTIESWDISINMLKEMEKAISGKEDKDFEDIMKEYKENIEILKDKIEEFTKNIEK